MIDTALEGDPSAVRGLASWLRHTLATDLATAGDEQQSARGSARAQWEGEAASSYQALSATVLGANDHHEARVKRAATALDDYAARLERCGDAMQRVRSRAREGGLAVIGTFVVPPPAVAPTVVAPGSVQEAELDDAVARIELYDELAAITASEQRSFADWVDSTMPASVADAEEKDLAETVVEEVKGVLPNFIAGSLNALGGLALLDVSKSCREQAREFRRRARVSGDPRVGAHAASPEGRAHLDGILKKAGWLEKGGRVLTGPGGIAIDVGFGIKDGIETGDWTRAALTTGASIATGVAVTGLVAAGVVTAPAWAVVLGTGALAAGVSWGVGQAYDHWDDITDWAGDRADDVADFASDTWDSATDVAGDAWDAVTPW